jgi:hypothetical protein
VQLSSRQGEFIQGENESVNLNHSSAALVATYTMKPQLVKQKQPRQMPGLFN